MRGAELAAVLRLIGALAIFVLWLWPLLWALSQWRPVKRLFGFDLPRPPAVAMPMTWRERGLRGAQLLALVYVYTVIAQWMIDDGDTHPGQAAFWIALSIVYAITWWAGWLADRTAVRPGARRHRAPAPGPASAARFPGPSASRAIAPRPESREVSRARRGSSAL